MPTPKEEQRCQFYYADGRRCRMAKLDQHPSLCAYHWDQGEQENKVRASAKDLLSEIKGKNETLDTAASVTRALSKVFELVIQQRLPARTAGVLAYIAQLLLLSIPQTKKERGDVDQFLRMLMLKAKLEDMHVGQAMKYLRVLEKKLQFSREIGPIPTAKPNGKKASKGAASPAASASNPAKRQASADATGAGSAP